MLQRLFAVTLTVLCNLVTGCSTSDRKPASESQLRLVGADAHRVLNVAIENPLEKKSPAITNGPAKLVLTMVAAPLTSYDRFDHPDGNGLADHWSVSADGMTYRFHLRSGLHWHSGPHGFQPDPKRGLSAEDVVYTFERMMDPTHPLHTTPMTKGVFSYWEFDDLAHVIESVHAENNLDVTIKLKVPNFEFGQIISQFAFIISSREYGEWCVQQWREQKASAEAAAKAPPWQTDPTLNPLSWFDREIVGTGPFRLTDWNEKTSVVQIDSVKSVPTDQFDRIIFTPIPKPEDRAAALRSGQVQIAINPDPATVTQLRSENIAVQEVPSKNLSFLVFHPSVAPEIRKAISMAIDRTQLVQRVFAGDAKASGSVIDSTLLPSHYQSPEVFRFNEQSARKTLEAAVKNGSQREITLVYPPGTRSYNPVPDLTAGIIALDLQSVGFNVAVATVGSDGQLLYGTVQKDGHVVIEPDPARPGIIPSMAKYSERMMNGSAPNEMILSGDAKTTNSGIDRLLNAVQRGIAKYKGGPATNYSGWSLEAYDAKVNDIYQTSNGALRTKLLAEAEMLMVNGGLPLVPLTTTPVRVAVSPNIAGFRVSPDGYIRLGATKQTGGKNRCESVF
jgi:dipeptide transport system substrate-binding protein